MVIEIEDGKSIMWFLRLLYEIFDSVVPSGNSPFLSMEVDWCSSLPGGYERWLDRNCEKEDILTGLELE